MLDVCYPAHACVSMAFHQLSSHWNFVGVQGSAVSVDVSSCAQTWTPRPQSLRRVISCSSWFACSAEIFFSLFRVVLQVVPSKIFVAFATSSLQRNHPWQLRPLREFDMKKIEHVEFSSLDSFCFFFWKVGVQVMVASIWLIIVLRVIVAGTRCPLTEQQRHFETAWIILIGFNRISMATVSRAMSPSIIDWCQAVGMSLPTCDGVLPLHSFEAQTRS